MKYLIFCSLIFSSFTVHADNPLCNDIIRYACGPGEQNDGTGSVKSEKQVRLANRNLMEKYEAKSEEKVKEALEKSKDPAFPEVAKAVLGLTHADACNSEEKAKTDKCKHDLEEGVSILVQKEILGESFQYPTSFRKVSAQELYFLKKNDTFSKIVEGLKKDALEDTKVSDLKDKIEDIFPRIKELVLEKIDSMPITPENKKLLKKRISIANFDRADCDFGDDSGRKRPLNELLIPNAHYNPINNKFHYCNSYLKLSDSMFTIISTIVHELTHAIGPCLITVGPRDLTFEYSDYSDINKMQAEYPLSGLLYCLRSPTSIQAQRSDQNEDSKSTSSNKNPDQAPVTKPSVADAQPTATGDNPFCGGEGSGKEDQIDEATSDWFSAEITPKLIAERYKLTEEQYRIGYSNVFRAACNNEQGSRNKSLDKMIAEKEGKDGKDAKEKGFDDHPPIYKRYNNLLLAQPEIREQMGCSKQNPKFIHCTAEMGSQYGNYGNYDSNNDAIKTYENSQEDTVQEGQRQNERKGMDSVKGGRVRVNEQNQKVEP